MDAALKEKLIRYASEAEPFSEKNHLKVIDVGEGVCTLQVELETDCLNRWKAPHGGLLFSMCDVAQGTAILGARQEMVVTVSSSIDFIAAAASSGVLTATGKVDRMGRKMCFASAEIHDENGKLIVSSHCVMCFTGKVIDL